MNLEYEVNSVARQTIKMGDAIKIAAKYAETMCKKQRIICAKYVVDNFAIPLDSKNKELYKKITSVKLATELK